MKLSHVKLRNAFTGSYLDHQSYELIWDIFHGAIQAKATEKKIQKIELGVSILMRNADVVSYFYLIYSYQIYFL